MTKEELERYLAEGLSLEQIRKRVGRSRSTISYHIKKHGLKPVNRGRHAARGPLAELKLRTMVFEGKTIREIARELDRSPSTVRHWLLSTEFGSTPPRPIALRHSRPERVESR